MYLLLFRKSFCSLGLCLAVFLVAVFRIHAQSLEKTDHGAVIHSKRGMVRVEVCSDNVVHIVAGPTANHPIKQIVPTVIQSCSGEKFTTTSDGSRDSVQTANVKVEVDEATGAIRFFTASGDLILGEQPQKGRSVPGSDNPDSSDRVRQTFLLSPGESLYGLGQHQEGLFNLRSIPVRLLQANTNIAIPFLISTNGYGLLWNNPALTDFNPATETVQLDQNGMGTFQTGPEGEYGFLLSGNYRNKLELSVDGQKIIDLKNMWLPLSAGAKMPLAANTTYKVIAETGGDTKLAVRTPSDTMTFRSQVGDAVDYYFFYGPEPSKVVAEYREFTGPVPLLPRWAFGFWQCRERYSSQQQILDTADEFRKRKIPVDVLVQDWQYWGKYGWNAMRFDESEYPNPAEMMTALHRQKFHLVISVWAKFGAETAVDKDFVAHNLVLKSAASTGAPGETKERENWADLFNPEAQKMFWSAINQNLFSAGLDGWWLDASEPEGDPLKDDTTYLGAGTKVRNAYPLFETTAAYQGQRATSEDKRVVILTRSAYAGEQRNGVISWSGDISGNWETFRRQIPAGLSFAMSGFPYWTTDIGGFFRPADQYTSPEYHELLIRWFQFGAFCPIFRIHGFRSETEMWKYGPDVERVLRQYDELRYRLLPYIYSAAWGVTDRGEIVMKALPFAYPGDNSVRLVSDQFLFGDSLLVSPVTEPHATTRSVVLPNGDNWVDFWTGQAYRGGQTITADAPLDRMPILVKEGSIVPMGPVVQNASEIQNPLELRIYPGKDASFELYEDSGDGYAYERGARATLQLRWNEHQKTLSIENRSGRFPNMISKRTLRIVLVKPGRGVGDGAASSVDRTVNYDGRAMKVDLRETK
ncbi:MAG: TIM-barrel domain-containing protein [Terracidiphilus sp.]